MGWGLICASRTKHSPTETLCQGQPPRPGPQKGERKTWIKLERIVGNMCDRSVAGGFVIVGGAGKLKGASAVRSAAT